MNTVRLVFLLVLLPSGPALLAPSTPPGLQPCSQAEQEQLDFWIGEWKLTWPLPKAEVAPGSNSIKPVLEGCTVGNPLGEKKIVAET